MSDIPGTRELTESIGDAKTFVLHIVQPGLAGLMDGSVSTLAPIFATAFATDSSHTVFLIGAASAAGGHIQDELRPVVSSGDCGRGWVFAAGVLIGQS